MKRKPSTRRSVVGRSLQTPDLTEIRGGGALGGLDPSMFAGGMVGTPSQLIQQQVQQQMQQQISNVLQQVQKVTNQMNQSIVNALKGL